MASANQTEDDWQVVPAPIDLEGPFSDFDARSGVDYALRTLAQTQVQFSLMADAKANIMITVCSLVISASLTQLHRDALFLPLVVLDAFTIVALLAALLCALPSKRKPPQRAEGGVDVEDAGFNPLFFQHFSHLSCDEFERELARRWSSAGGIYRSLARDVYFGGAALARQKFRYLPRQLCRVHDRFRGGVCHGALASVRSMMQRTRGPRHSGAGSCPTSRRPLPKN